MPMPITNFFWIDAVLLDVAAEIDEDVFVMMYEFAGTDSNTRVMHSTHTNSLHDEMVAVGAVTHIHVKRCSGRTLLLIAIYLEALGMNMMAPEQQLLDSRWIAMEIDDDGAIGSEQGIKHLVIQPMRMGALRLQYEQIGDIHDTHTQFGQF